MSYKVKLDIFEGPFDLLVYLIERSGLSIYDVNISEIIDQYIGYVDQIKIIDPDTAAEFMVLAATLIQIKSKTLLPSENQSGGDKENSADPRDELADKIAEYRRIKNLAQELHVMEEEASHIYAKPREDMSGYAPCEELELDTDRFIEAFKAFLEKRRRMDEVRRRYEKIDREHMTMEAKHKQLKDKLDNAARVSFSDLIDDINDKYDIVLTFVTLLEMLKSGMIIVAQDFLFGEIAITGSHMSSPM